MDSVWKLRIRGNCQFVLCKKLHFLKKALKKLNAKHFSHISARDDRASKALKDLQLQLFYQPNNEVLQGKLLGLRKEAKVLAEAKHHFFSQRAKCSFLKNSDHCTNFFHDMVKPNAKRNFIAAVYKDDEIPTYSAKEVEDEFICFYEGLLGTSSSCQPIDPGVLRYGRCISSDQAHSLTGCISSQEIKDALFSIGDEKSPGPDGFSSFFFKRSWNIFGDNFYKVI